MPKFRMIMQDPGTPRVGDILQRRWYCWAEQIFTRWRVVDPARDTEWAECVNCGRRS